MVVTILQLDLNKEKIRKEKGEETFIDRPWSEMSSKFNEPNFIKKNYMVVQTMPRTMETNETSSIYKVLEAIKNTFQSFYIDDTVRTSNMIISSDIVKINEHYFYYTKTDDNDDWIMMI